ncbi:hypothetical protein B0I18_108100 [Taibaiella chishuiensis]|uniref:Uncharacterized protein n=1 Tax=Taibaiella chishuiensis TaxID=1434707 RepID=A0A2P8CZI0_9BACT|nr:hypothetical protein B0I18_108100 [Taibaiella chishuiensis]
MIFYDNMGKQYFMHRAVRVLVYTYVDNKTYGVKHAPSGINKMPAKRIQIDLRIIDTISRPQQT